MQAISIVNACVLATLCIDITARDERDGRIEIRSGKKTGIGPRLQWHMSNLLHPFGRTGGQPGHERDVMAIFGQLARQIGHAGFTAAQRFAFRKTDIHGNVTETEKQEFHKRRVRRNAVAARFAPFTSLPLRIAAFCGELPLNRKGLIGAERVRNVRPKGSRQFAPVVRRTIDPKELILGCFLP